MKITTQGMPLLLTKVGYTNELIRINVHGCLTNDVYKILPWLDQLQSIDKKLG